jgi:acyl carrier protein
MKDEIMNTVRAFIIDHFLAGEESEALDKATPLMGGGILDSIAVLKTVVFLEEQYGIKVEAHEVSQEHFDTLETIADLVDRKLAEKK